MRNPIPVRKILQFPLAIGMIAVKCVVEFVDFILDHTNTPIANLIDAICLDLQPELGQHAVMLVGAALHAYLYNMYLFGIELFIGGIAAAIFPVLNFAMPIMIMGVGGLVVLNQLVCLKKIFTASNPANNVENIAATTDRLELMRSRPLESGLKIFKRVLNPIFAFPEFVNEAYVMACNMKSAIASVLWPWERSKEPLVFAAADISNVVTAGLGTGLPLEGLDPVLTEQIEATDTKQPLIFSEVGMDDNKLEQDISSDCATILKIKRCNTWPLMTLNS